MTNAPSAADQIRGEALMRRADDLTAFRQDTSPIIGLALAVTDSEYLTTAAILGEVYTDYKDGSEARKGAAILGVETSIEGAIEDPKADKTLANSLMLGLIVRFIRHKNIPDAAVVAANYIASKNRDRNMQENRDLALEHNLDPKALPINKVKFLAQMVGNLLLSSPFSRNKRVKQIGLTALTGGTIIGIVGERIFRNKVHKAIQKNELKWALECPDTLPAT
jgi:phosphatidylglycerophosphate synthase